MSFVKLFFIVQGISSEFPNYLVEVINFHVWPIYLSISFDVFWKKRVPIPILMLF